MALAEKRICEHTDATTISSADEFIVDSMANGTRNITMTNLENQILSTDTYSALTGIGDGTITGSIADIDSNLNNLTYDSTTNRLTMTGNTAFSGTIDSVPTAGSGNAVSSGGTKTYVDSAVSQLNDEIDAKRSLTVSSSIIGNAVNVKTATSTSPYITPHEGFVRFDGPTCTLCVNTYRVMRSSANDDYKGMWLPKGVSIYFTDGTPHIAQWFNCSNE